MVYFESFILLQVHVIQNLYAIIYIKMQFLIHCMFFKDFAKSSPSCINGCIKGRSEGERYAYY